MTPAESGCRMTNAARLGAFVQATIVDPATGRLSVYGPLVVTRGIRPAVKPTIPPIPADAVVTIAFGFNGKDLFQVGAMPTTLADADCVNGQAGSVFGPMSFCNGVKFFEAVQKDERAGLLTVPSHGQVIGITVGGSGSGLQIIGYAIPINTALAVATRIADGDSSGTWAPQGPPLMTPSSV